MVAGTVEAYLGLGSNVGTLHEKVTKLRAAVDAIERAHIGQVTARSSIYLTPPWGHTEQDEFVNAVIRIRTELPARQLLSRLKDIEIDLGRVPTFRWGPRLIDIDILTYGSEQVDEPGLHIPHREMERRAFVMIPLREIAPDWPADSGLHIAEDAAQITRLDSL